MIIQETAMQRLSAIVLASPRSRPVRAVAPLWLCNDWLAACTARLSQLRPDQSGPAMASMARTLWLDVPAFDPVIAAEMEYQTWLAGDHADEPAAAVLSL